MKFRIHTKILFLLTLLISGTACKKGFLDKKSDIQLQVPQTLDDLQALLDADRFLNGSRCCITEAPVPAIGEIASDSYYMTFTDWQANANFKLTRSHIWDKVVFNQTVPDWNNAYRAVFYANNVLAVLPTIPITAENETRWNSIKATALFFRAHAFYQLVQIFAKPYDKNTASTDPGIPLRLTPDIFELSVRASVQETYDRMITDLTEAYSYLPPLVSTPQTRPNRPAAFALLARAYLNMEDYGKVKMYTDSALNLYNTLMDYNDATWVTPTANIPFKRFNPEIVFHAIMLSDIAVVTGATVRIDTLLFNSYNTNDLRRTAFFRTNGTNLGFRFKGTYESQTNAVFAGIANDEVYLMRAEANARLGNVQEAMVDLNALMIKRWRKTVVFVPITATNATDALNKVLTERRKELLFRGLRWTDLRRLNKQGANITLTRKLDQVYTLPPNDKRWVFPIPPDVIIANPGMAQNDR